MIEIAFKAIRKALRIVNDLFYTPYAKLIFYLNGIAFGVGLSVKGIMKIHVTRRGKVKIGDYFEVNSGYSHNIIGRQQKTIFWVEGKLTIGNNVGMSATAIVCNHDIEIGNNVIIGGNTVIYDSDFHSLDPYLRSDRSKDKTNAKWGKVMVKDGAFIGSHSTILKGVTIGRGAVLGAGSVATKDIPDGEIWAGNPAKFLRKVDN